jgi:hypothetical protein
MDFDHFAVILKVTNVPYGTPVKQTDIIDLVWQNGDHQGVRFGGWLAGRQEGKRLLGGVMIGTSQPACPARDPLERKPLHHHFTPSF